MAVGPRHNWLRTWLRLSERGVLGMNRRNIRYIGRYNPRALFPLVDDKLLSKKLALEHGLNVPQLAAVIENQHDVLALESLLSTSAVDLSGGFCIKPAKGSGGKGILVVSRAREGSYYKTSGQALSVKDVQRHVSNVLAGLFSLGGATDVAMIEQRIELDPSLAGFSYEGVPDIRVIVFRGLPVMAMMRLSCASSHGKANLHQGAVGVGIDLASGRAINAVQLDKPLRFHPDTGQDLLELALPRWQELLELACACADMTGLGYLGVDLVLDRRRGPMLLELNARPGLSIQIANNAGLLPRLRRVEGIKYADKMLRGARIAFAQEYFGHAAAPGRLGASPSRG